MHEVRERERESGLSIVASGVMMVTVVIVMIVMMLDGTVVSDADEYV